MALNAKPWPPGMSNHQWITTAIILSLVTFTWQEQKFINIVLSPRDWQDPTLADGYFCGNDLDIDSGRLLAEFNTKFIFHLIDQTKDVTPGYRTSVFDLLAFDKKKQPNYLLDKLSCTLEKDEPGLYTVFLAPRSRQCNELTFEDVSTNHDGYHQLAVLVSSNLEEVKEWLILHAETYKILYGGHLPKVCATGLMMSDEAANARQKELTSVFNFQYNEDRHIQTDIWKMCKTVDDTINSITKSSLFDVDSTISFKNEKQIIHENDGFTKIVISRNTPTCQKALGFVTTDFPSSGDQCSPASEDDIVPLSNLIVFNEGETETEVIVRVKKDEEIEETECFDIHIKKVTEILKPKRRKRELTSDDKFSIKMFIIDMNDFANSLCFEDRDCKSRLKSFCNTADNTCQACKDDDHCQHTAPFNKCSNEHFCAECLGNLDCTAGQECSIGACRPCAYTFLNIALGKWSVNRATTFVNEDITFHNLALAKSNSYKKRCKGLINGGPEAKHIHDVLPKHSSWATATDEASILTKCALQIYDLLLTKYSINKVVTIKKQDAAFTNQCIAIGLVKNDELDNELYIAGNLVDTLLNRPSNIHAELKDKRQHTWYTQAEIIEDMLMILDKEQIEYYKVVAIRPKEKTSGGKNSHKHAEMQIVDYINKKGGGKKLHSIHVTKPPCCACNTVLDKKLNHENDEDNAYDPPFDAEILNTYSAVGTILCAEKKICASQYYLENLAYWTHPANFENPMTYKIDRSNPSIYPSPFEIQLFPLL